MGYPQDGQEEIAAKQLEYTEQMQSSNFCGQQIANTDCLRKRHEEKNPFGYCTTIEAE